MSAQPSDKSSITENTQGTSIDNARTCPFCGGWPTVQPWHGGGPLKTMVSCDNDACDAAPMVSGPTKKKAIERWNTRTP